MAEPAPGVGHSNSMDSHDETSNLKEKKKSRRPANTAFRQQRLKAWQPILTPKTVLPIFFAIGIVFAPIGALLLYASAKVQELRLDYTDCAAKAGSDFTLMDAKYVKASFKSDNTSVSALWSKKTINHTYVGDYVVTDLTRCTLQFTLPESIGPPVLAYYYLTNFYQNHRRYVNSFFDKQLKGTPVDAAAVATSSCSPLMSPDKVITKSSKPYYPCGLIANSLFNDTISQPVLVTTGDAKNNETYVMSESNIAWDSDKALFGNLPADTDWDSILPPPNWQRKYKDGKYSSDARPPNLNDNEHLMVWMRTAGLPSFSKLYMRNDTEAMKPGTYTIDIIDNFNTTLYHGTKSLIFTTKTVMGGQNPFLGIAYIVVGGICILLGALFSVTHLIKPRKLGDHTYLSWNNAPGPGKAGAGAGGPSMGMATGRDVA